MRRADRLFDIIQILRRRKLVRAVDLAEALQVSERTIYRDINDLTASGVPIVGEAGMGYVLKKGFDLPPLMFDEKEIEALVLGARIVRSWADEELSEAAANAMAKVETVIPERLKRHMSETALLAPDDHFVEPISVELAALRSAIREKRKVRFFYQDAEGRKSTRTVRPLALFFYGPIWLLLSWCEMRQDFRSFRLDRIEDFSILEERFFPEFGKTLNDYLKRHPDRYDSTGLP